MPQLIYKINAKNQHTEICENEYLCKTHILKILKKKEKKERQ